MPQRCSVPFCCNYGGHQFPKNKQRRLQWRIAIKRLDPRTKKLWEPNDRGVVCDLHFVASDYKDTSAKGEQQTVSFEYKYSFKGPQLTLDNKSIPFWDYGGDAIAGDDYIILTSHRRNKRGWVWSTLKTSFNQWSVECVFKVTGRGRVGAEGLAVWFTEDKGQEGPVFGNQDMWRGLGVFMDSFDNDGQHNNPYTMAMVNGGTQQYDHQSDGSKQQLGGCPRDFRNKPSE